VITGGVFTLCAAEVAVVVNRDLGGITSWGPGIAPLEVHGEIGSLRIAVGLRAAGSQEA
jgi:hypothetical protein